MPEGSESFQEHQVATSPVVSTSNFAVAQAFGLRGHYSQTIHCLKASTDIWGPLLRHHGPPTTLGTHYYALYRLHNVSVANRPAKSRIVTHLTSKRQVPHSLTITLFGGRLATNVHPLAYLSAN